MGVADKILIGLSIINCILSLFALHLVQRNLKKKRRREAYAKARERSRVELSMTELLKGIAAAESMTSDRTQQIIHVKGTRKGQNIENEIA